MRLTAITCLVGALLITACKQQEEAAKDVGRTVAQTRVQEPIQNARRVVAKLEKSQSVLFDPTSNLFHKTGCRNADVSTMEALTMGAAEERGGKPDKACLPGQ